MLFRWIHGVKRIFMNAPASTALLMFIPAVLMEIQARMMILEIGRNNEVK
jgi:hypothetical protein